MRGGHHFIIGKSHDVCEDYAASCDTFAALSDGCSIVKDQDGNRIEAHTDVGSRLLVRAAFAHRWNVFEEFPDPTIKTADRFRRELLLGEAALSATLLCLRAEHGVVRAFICGDGAVFGRHRTEGWVGWSYNFDGPPYYLRYRLCDGPMLSVTASSLTGQQERYNADPIRQLVFGLPDYDLVAAMSDGVFSFTKNGVSVPFDRDFALRLLDFRRMGGKFMVRHLRGTLAELERDGIVNQDDVSMVALYAGD